MIDALPRFPRRLLIIGHSHLQALQDAVTLYEGTHNKRHPSVQFVQLLSPELAPTLLDDGTINPAVTSAIAAAIADGEAPLLIDCISGNEYQFLGLVNHPRPFDFFLPSRPDLPVRHDAEMIPGSLVRQALKSQMGYAIRILTQLRKALSGPVWHIQSPPPMPMPTADFIAGNTGHFAQEVSMRGLSPPALRMKLWLLQSEIYRATCDELDIGFIAAPAEACDAAGYMLPQGWSRDYVHATRWYGEIVLRQLQAIPAIANQVAAQ